MPEGTDVRSVLQNSHIHLSHAGWRGSGWNYFTRPIQSVCKRHAYADTAVIATSRQSALLVIYLETYLSDLELWLSEWRVAINVSKSSAMLFAKTGRRIPNPRAVQLFGESIEWVDDVRYLGMTLDKRLTWSMHIDQVRKKAA
jgi:hypothetical protein